MSRLTDWFGKTFNGKRVSLLGLKGGGKSQFLHSLGCKEANPGTLTSRERYGWFKIVYPSKTIYIKAGYDIGGGLELFKKSFNKHLINSDWVLFVIDIQKFINNELDVESILPYKEMVFARLDYINDNVSNKFKDKFAIILTHVDLMDKPENVLINEFQNATNSKVYSHLASQVYSIDARKPEQVKTVFKVIARL